MNTLPMLDNYELYTHKELQSHWNNSKSNKAGKRLNKSERKQHKNIRMQRSNKNPFYYEE